MNQQQNRSFEFRAWHLPTRVMHYDVFFDEEHVYSDSNYNVPLPLTDCVIMQYTGSNDPFGAKIYEGDVLRDDYDFPDMEDHVQFSSYLFVTFYKGCFAMFHVDDVDRDYDDCDDPYLTNALYREVVVGNRYEHPHLLKLIEEQPLRGILSASETIKATPHEETANT